MYLTHFGFTHYPFDHALQPDELYPSAAAREAQARLKHLIELRGIGLITGEVGSGKSTVCRQLCAAVGADRILTHRADRILTQGWELVAVRPTVDKCTRGMSSWC